MQNVSNSKPSNLLKKVAWLFLFRKEVKMIRKQTLHKGIIFAMTLVLIIGLVTIENALAASSVFINEIHYDNISTDIGEAVEILGPAGIDLSGWSLTL